MRGARLQGKVVRLASKTDQPYIGIKVSDTDTAVCDCITIMRSILGKDAETYARNQRDRDRGAYHITLVIPREYTHDADVIIGNTVSCVATGLGHARNDRSQAYFVVIHAPAAQELRARLGMAPRDLHVTLGFDPKDVHDRPKDDSALVARLVT